MHQADPRACHQADIVLLHPSYSYPDKGPPLGLAYLQAYLKTKGISCSLIDIDGRGLSRRQAVLAVQSKNPRILGISFMTNQAPEAYSLARQCKTLMPGLTIVAGGCHTSALPHETIRSGFDAAVVGEGEEAFHRLAGAVLGGERILEDAPSILLKEADEEPVVRASATGTPVSRAPAIEDLDNLPFPDHSDLGGGRYGDTILGSKIVARTFCVLTSRGCPNDCIFCASRCVFDRRFRKRSAENIMLELVDLRERYGARLIKFVDDTLTIDKPRVLKLCDLLVGSGMGLEWTCNARVNTVDRELLGAMASAGCKNVSFGVESGDPEVLSRIKKKISLDQVREAHALARKAGLAVSSFFMVGNMGETLESVQRTVDLAAEISDYPSVSIATPYPGTELSRICRENGWIRTSDWARYITIPHVLPDYTPVTTNGVLTAQELLDAYYYVNRKFMRQKLVSKYGRRFYLNRRFYGHEFGTRVRAGGLTAVAKVGAKLMSAKGVSARETVRHSGRAA